MPDQNSRFRMSLWDIHGYLQEVWLDRISDTQVVSELNGEKSFSFKMPMRDLYYPLIKHRKIIRLHDTQIDNVSYKVTSSGSGNPGLPYIISSQYDGIELGDYVSVYEHAPESFVGVISSPVTTPNEGVSISFSGASGSLSNDDYVKLIEPIDEEKLIASEYVRSPNSEVVQVSSVTGGSSTSGTFKSDLAYTYVKGTVILKPGRSFVARVLSKDPVSADYYLYLSRADFNAGTGAIINKVNFESYRIADIQESREGGTAIASIRCEHITNDLSDSLFFKDTRTDISYSSKGSGQIIKDRVGLDSIIDGVLYRQNDSNGTPLTTKSFIKGDLRRFTYSKGTVSRTLNSYFFTGDTTADISNAKISSGSKIYVEGAVYPYTVAYIDGDRIVTTAQMTSAITDAKYMIVSQGIQSTVTERSGTADVDGNYLDEISFSVRRGDVQTGAIVNISGESEDYKVVYVTGDYTTASDDYYADDKVYIDRTLGTSITGCKITIKSDEKEFNVSSMVTSKGVLRQAVEEFSNDKQEIYYFVGEDRSVNIIRKPIPDDRDPTSDLIVQYRDNQVRNLRSVSRDFEISEFGNRIIPQGANSGWTNSESGFKTLVAANITGSVTGGVATGPNNNTFNIEDSTKDFKALGVHSGMLIKDLSGAFGIITHVNQAVGGSVTYPGLTYHRGSQLLSPNESYIIDYHDTMRGKSQLKITGGDEKFLRFGDPLQIYQNSKNIEIAEVSQIQVRRGITGKTDNAAGGTYQNVIDTTRNFDTLGIEKGMMISLANEVSDSPSHIINTISSTSGTNNTLNIYPDTSTSITVGTEYRIAKIKQITYRYDTSTATFLDYSKELLVGGLLETPATVEIFPISDSASGNSFYFACTEVFDYIAYDLVTKGTISGSNTEVTTPLQWEYSSGTNGSTWTDLDFEAITVNEQTKSLLHTVNFATEDIGGYINRFDPPSDWAKITMNASSNQYGSVSAYAVRVRITSSVAGDLYSVAPKIRNVKCFPWRKDELKGGLVRIDSGNSKGAIRRITSNTYDRLTINRRFDVPSDVLGQSAVVSGKIGNTFVKGFGYRQVNILNTASSTTDDAIIIEDILPIHSYCGGQLTVKTGTGKNQTFTIAANDINSDNRTIIKVIGKFSPKPEPNDKVEIIGLPQMLFDKPVVATASSRGKAATNPTDFYKSISFNLFETNWFADQWIGGYAHISESGKFQSHEIIANNTTTVFLGDPIPKTSVTTVSSTFSSSATTITIGATSGLDITGEDGVYIVIDDEMMTVNSIVDGTHVVVVRGAGGTTATSHNSGATVFTVRPADVWKIGGTEYEATIDAKVTLIKENRLNVSINTAEGIVFSPEYGDDISLLLKESGGPLTVGKHASNRTFSTVSTENIVSVLPGMASKFNRNDLIFVGTKDVSSKLYFNIGRGDQVQGQQATVKKSISISGTTNVTYASTTYSNIIDTGKNFVELGVTAGMSIRVDGKDLIITNIKDYVSGSTYSNAMLEFGFSDGIDTASSASYSIDSIVTNESLYPIPQSGDHVELIGFVDSLSIRKNEIVEISNNDSSTNDPKLLYDNAVKKLNKISSIEPRYTVSFIDLYEYDSDAYKYDKYILGDTIKVIDEDITGPGGTNLRVIKESYSPELPADKSHTLEVGKRSRDFIRDDFVTLRQQVRDMNAEIQGLKKVTESARCLWWNPTTKSCTKPYPPNAFCESEESNQDGILTREKIQITQLHCQSYQPAIAGNIGADQAEIRMFEYVSTVDNSNFSDDKTIGVDTDFALSTKSRAIITDIRVYQNIASGIAPGQVTVRLKLDNDGQIFPYSPVGEEVGTGGYLEYKRTDPDDDVVYSARIVLIAIGNKI